MTKVNITTTVEILKGCKHCGNCPRMSVYTHAYIERYELVCCRIGRKSDTPDLAVYFWNNANQSCDKTYRINRKTNDWELISETKN